MRGARSSLDVPRFRDSIDACRVRLGCKKAACFARLAEIRPYKFALPRQIWAKWLVGSATFQDEDETAHLLPALRIFGVDPL